MELNRILLFNITSLIKINGMTESECLRLCHVHNNFLSNLRNGKLKSPSLENVYSIAKFFGVSIDGMLLYKPENKGPKLEYNEKRNYRVVYEAYRRLDAAGKAAVNETLMRERERMKNQKK